MTNPTKYTRTYKIVFSVFAASLLLLVTQLTFPIHCDEIFFKAPGLSWARTGGWNSPEEENYLGWQPPLQEVFGSYPPLYPFFFGCIVKLVGFNYSICAAYDAIIHIGLSLVLIFAYRAANPKSIIGGYILGILYLLCWYAPRPDSLAMIFGYGSIALLLKADTSGKLSMNALAGALFGLCVASSVPCGFALTPLVTAIILFEPNSIKGSKRLAVYGTCALFVTILVVAPVLMYDSGALEQNLNATKSVTSNSFWTSLKPMLISHFDTLSATVLLLIPCVIAGANLLVRPHLKKSLAWLVWYGSILLPMCFFFLRSTFQGHYHWFFIPWLAIAARRFHFESIQTPTWHYVLLIAAFTLPISIQFRTAICCVVAPYENQKIDTYRKTVESIVPPTASVLAAEYWWVLGNRNKVHDVLNVPA